MGSDAMVFVFDYRRYVERVVPAVHEWLRTYRLPSEEDWRYLVGCTLPAYGAA